MAENQLYMRRSREDETDGDVVDYVSITSVWMRKRDRSI